MALTNLWAGSSVDFFLLNMGTLTGKENAMLRMVDSSRNELSVEETRD